MNFVALAGILETVISDVPTLLSVVEKLVTIFKDNRAPTDDEWTQINALVDASHAKLQGDN